MNMEDKDDGDVSTMFRVVFLACLVLVVVLKWNGVI